MKRIVTAACLCALLGACAGPPKESPTVALPTPPPPGEPAGLVGIEATALRVAFGPPAFVRKDGNVELWRYDAASCKAFFFLYPKDGALAVRHVETLPRGRDIAADSVCLDALRVRPPAPVS